MPSHVALGLLAAASLVVAIDTTVVVRPETRLVLRIAGGHVRVQGWDRGVVRIEADRRAGERLRVVRQEDELAVDAEAAARGRERVNYRLTVPRAMPVSLTGRRVSAVVRGVRADVSVRTVTGGIELEGGTGRVDLSSIIGPITVVGARGELYVNSVDGPIDLREIVGRILAETVNGPIALARVVSDTVEASTVNGSLCYDGTIRDGGRYRFATHTGDIAVGLPDDAGATVLVATYDGQVLSDFPTGAQDRALKQFQFRVGSGRAILEMESFLGSIRLRRSGHDWMVGQPPCRDGRPTDQKEEEEK